MAKGYYHYACLKDYDTAVRYFEQARQLLPNSSRIPESLAYVARRQGQWDRSSRTSTKPSGSTRATFTCSPSTRFPISIFVVSPKRCESLIRFSILHRTTSIRSCERRLLHKPRAIFHGLRRFSLRSTRAPTIPAVGNTSLPGDPGAPPCSNHRSAKGNTAKPDPALGYINGELRFWLGWAQEVAGDHAAAQETWRQARSELEPFLKEQPENYFLIGDLALTNMGLGDKAAAFAFVEKAIAAIPIEKDALDGPVPIEILARVAAQMGEPDRAIAALQKLLSIPYAGPLAANVPLTPALLRLDPMFDPLRNDPRFQKLAAVGSTETLAQIFWKFRTQGTA